MAIFAVGPLVAGATPAQIEARQVRRAGLGSDIVIPTGQFRVDVTAAVGVGNPQAFVGRRFVRNDGSLVTVTPSKASMLAEWTGRARQIFLDGMEAKRGWWPHVYRASDPGLSARSTDIVVVEITQWLSGMCHVLMGAATGRAWPSMTVAQVDACFAHVENFLGAGGVETWYRIGQNLNFSDASYQYVATYNGRDATSYTSATSASLGYTDAFDTSGSGTSRILVPRTPDYRWVVPAGFVSASDWDPENPA